MLYYDRGRNLGKTAHTLLKAVKLAELGTDVHVVCGSAHKLLHADKLMMSLIGSRGVLVASTERGVFTHIKTRNTIVLISKDVFKEAQLYKRGVWLEDEEFPFSVFNKWLVNIPNFSSGLLCIASKLLIPQSNMKIHDYYVYKNHFNNDLYLRVVSSNTNEAGVVVQQVQDISFLEINCVDIFTPTEREYVKCVIQETERIFDNSDVIALHKTTLHSKLCVMYGSPIKTVR